jgi:enoyl-CoA hydratase
LPKLIGDQRTRELAYTGRTFHGKEAESMGLVLQCFDTNEELMNHVKKVASDIASKSPLTIRGIKKTILYTRDHTVQDSLEQIQLWNGAHFISKDLMEAMRATMKKEKPKYTED